MPKLSTYPDFDIADLDGTERLFGWRENAPKNFGLPLTLIHPDLAIPADADAHVDFRHGIYYGNSTRQAAADFFQSITVGGNSGVFDPAFISNVGLRCNGDTSFPAFKGDLLAAATNVAGATIILQYLYTQSDGSYSVLEGWNTAGDDGFGISVDGTHHFRMECTSGNSATEPTATHRPGAMNRIAFTLHPSADWAFVANGRSEFAGANAFTPNNQAPAMPLVRFASGLMALVQTITIINPPLANTALMDRSAVI